jgi:hypothetical protein
MEKGERISAFPRLHFSAVLLIRICFNADPDSAFYLSADPDPGSQTIEDPDPGQTFPSRKV